jgi:exopolyphosphatase/pppGpp-phosphohydrolase
MAGIGKDRADIIMGGIVIFKAVLDVLAPQKIVVADVGVREGVFLDKTEGHGILG